MDSRSASTLEQRKLAAEVEKLEREDKVLRNPFSRPAAWVPIVVAVVSIGPCGCSGRLVPSESNKRRWRPLRNLPRSRQSAKRLKRRSKESRGSFTSTESSFCGMLFKNLNDTAAVQAYSQENWRQVMF